MTALIARKVFQKSQPSHWQVPWVGKHGLKAAGIRGADSPRVLLTVSCTRCQQLQHLKIACWWKYRVYFWDTRSHIDTYTQFSSGTPVLLSSDWFLIGLSPRVRGPCSCLSLLSLEGSASKQCICATESNKLLYHTGGLVLQLHYMITIVAFHAPESSVFLQQKNADHCDSKQRMEKNLMVYGGSVCLMCRRLNMLQTNNRFANDVTPLKACIWIMMASCNGE